ncbi:50S ribosomal protein L21 [Candidatus Parcubacteria bacterium]|nr:50S ribosomal protein L21 [Candidatus Parcubacteria bacterium]
MAEVRTHKVEATKAEPKELKTELKQKKAHKADVFAVFTTGGKQYLVRPGVTLKIEKILGEHKEGDTIEFDQVLVSGEGDKLTFGVPFISGGAISATLTKIGRHKTIDVIKYKQKSRYFKKNGHRQPYFEVRIDSIK